jgi:hypothetical protein
VTRRVTALVLTLVACAHEVPTWPSGAAPAPPLGAPPVRLTYNPARDRTPAWMPDGASIVYSYERTDRRDRDHCLGRLPAAGGTRAAVTCPDDVDSHDSTDVLDTPVPAPDGRLAYVWVVSRVLARVPSGGAVLVREAGRPERRLLTLPVPPAPGGGRDLWDRVALLAWLDDSTLLLRGERMALRQGGADTVVIGLELARLRLDGGEPEPLAGTAGATSGDADGAGGVYFTRIGDSVVYRVELTTGTVLPVVVFGGDSIVRGVRVRGNRLAVVVGGAARYQVDSVLGPIQPDEGGTLWVVDLGTGARTEIFTPRQWFRRIALSPDGRRLAAEGADFTITDVYSPGGVLLFSDTAVSAATDLWSFEVP